MANIYYQKAIHLTTPSGAPEEIALIRDGLAKIEEGIVQHPTEARNYYYKVLLLSMEKEPKKDLMKDLLNTSEKLVETDITLVPDIKKGLKNLIDFQKKNLF